MVKCGGCLVRIQHGCQPACAATCPTGALQMLEVEDAPAQHRQSSLREITQRIVDND